MAASIRQGCGEAIAVAGESDALIIAGIMQDRDYFEQQLRRTVTARRHYIGSLVRRAMSF